MRFSLDELQNYLHFASVYTIQSVISLLLRRPGKAAPQTAMINLKPQFILFTLSAAILLVACTDAVRKEPALSQSLAQIELTPKNIKYGLDLDKFEVTEGEIKPGSVMSELLGRFGVTASEIDVLVNNSRDVFDVKRIRPHKKWALLSTADSSSVPKYFVYEKDQLNYVVFSLADSLYAWKGQHPTTTEIRSISGVIESSLYQALYDEGLPSILALEMANVYAWTVDFYHLQKGDYFQVVFEEELVEEEPVGKPKILASIFLHKNKEFEAYYFEHEEVAEYFNEQGGSMRKAFLQAPVEFSRISSKYNKRRFHPVLKRIKAHLGTDYAAPRGTPIVATGDGTVTKSGYTAGNGNYVKIRHNSTYETQYLHMSKRAAKVGEVVKQGDVIGYVGSTGLATGPHVCYRFWKYGEQIDPFTEEIPSSEPLPEAYLPAFELVRDSLKSMFIVPDTAQSNEEALPL